MSKNDIISKTYFDLAGHGSMQSTYKQAHEKDKSITLKTIKDWYDKNVEQKTKYVGENSFVAKAPFEEFQIDLFFIGDLIEQKMKVGMLMIDIFTKYMTVIPMPYKNEEEVGVALLTGF